MDHCLMVLALLATTVGLTVAAVSQQPEKLPQPSAEEAAAMQEWMKLAAPGPAHKHLESFVGSWKTQTKMFMGGPGSQPMQSEGTAEVKWVLGGRFLLEHVKGTLMGQPYEGMGFTGYDNNRNMYVGDWVSNLGTSLQMVTGTRHPKTGVFTYYGEMDEPALKVIGRTVKFVHRAINEKQRVFEIIDLHAGDDYKVVEITYTRM